MEEKTNIELVSMESGLEVYGKRERIRRNQKIALFLTIFLMCMAMFLAYWNRTFNSYEVLYETPNTEGSNTRYEVFLDGYLKYSKDGISYINRKEQVLWTEAYTMDKPEVVVKDGYAALADMEGNGVNLYDETGKVGEFSMAYPVKKILVASQGVFCVVLETEDANYIRIFDRNGELLAEIKTKIENNGYPMAIAMASDGSRLAASFFRVDGIDAQNILSIYNFDEGGKGQSGNLVGTYQLGNTLIPKITFTDDHTIYAVCDSKMLVYDVEDKPEQLAEILYPTEIINVFGNEKYMGFTCENPQEEVAAEEAAPYEIYIYGKKGRAIRHFGVDKIYESVELVDNVLVGYTGSTCHMIRVNGKEAFLGEMGRNIVDILPTNRNTEFMMVYGDSTARIRLQNVMESVMEDTEEVEQIVPDAESEDVKSEAEGETEAETVKPENEKETGDETVKPETEGEEGVASETTQDPDTSTETTETSGESE